MSDVNRAIADIFWSVCMAHLGHLQRIFTLTVPSVYHNKLWTCVSQGIWTLREVK